MVRYVAVCGLTLWLMGCPSGTGEGLDTSGRPLSEGNLGPPVALAATFEALQANVFTPVCVTCHAGAAAPVGLRLDAANSFDMLVGVASVQVPGLARVAPGDPDSSYLVQKIEGTAAVGQQMPLGGPFLDTDTVDQVRAWIAAGALPPAPPAPDVPPTVIALTPVLDGTLTTAPTEIVVAFSKDMDATLVSDVTVTLTASGGDDAFGDALDQLVPVALALANSDPSMLMIDLDGQVVADDAYELRLVGSGATALADTDGVLLDGNADGIAGDDFVARFALDTTAPPPEATWRSIQDVVFTPVCTDCHRDGGIASFLRLDESHSYDELVGIPSTEVSSLLRVEPLNANDSYLVQKLEGSAAVGEQMPLGGEPLDDATIAAVRTWIDAGAVQMPGDPVPDVVPPAVVVAAPLGVLSGTVTLVADASDASGVTSVEFLIDGDVLGVDAVAPFEATWDTTVFANGTYAISARAQDPAGNQGTSSVVLAEVDNLPPPDMTPPQVALDDPGALVRGVVMLSASASDNVGVTQVHFTVDDVTVGTDLQAPFEFAWDSTSVMDGAYTLGARADDAAGNTAQSAGVDVTVDNAPPADTLAPVVTLTDPLATLAGTISLEVMASDDVGVTSVTVLVDGVVVGTDDTPPFAIALDTTALLDGNHVVSARAADAAGNTGTAAPLLVTIANGGPQPNLNWIQNELFDVGCTVGCHISDGIASFLLLDAANALDQLVNVAALLGGDLRVAPGDPDGSVLIERLEGTRTPQMPLGATPLPQNQIDVVRRWISDGALASPADVIAPAVSLRALAMPVAGVVILQADAVDDVAVMTVEFIVDGTVVGSVNTPPYQFDWDSTTVTNGAHTVSARAIDGASNSTLSLGQNVQINNVSFVNQRTREQP